MLNSYYDKSATFDPEYKDEWEFLEQFILHQVMVINLSKYYEFSIKLNCHRHRTSAQKKQLCVALIAGSLLTQGAGNSEIHVIIHGIRKYNIIIYKIVVLYYLLSVPKNQNPVMLVCL